MRTLVTAMAIPISATLRPLSFLFDSLVFRTEIAVVWLPSLLADLRRIPIPMARRRFHSLSMSGGWTAPLGKMLLIRNRSKQTACRAMELVGKAANATIEPQPAICLLKSDRGHRVYTEIEDRFLPQSDSPRAMNGAPQRPQNARRSR